MSDRAEETQTVEETTVLMYLIRYKDVLYTADCVEITPDTAFFQVEGQWVRKGVFPSNRLDLRWFKEMDLVLFAVLHPPVLEQ